MFHEIGVGDLVFLDHRVNDLKEEGLVDTEQAAVTGGAAEQAAQNVASALVGGNNPVVDHHRCRADMVCDDAQRDVLGGVLLVGDTGDAADAAHDPLDGIDLKEVIHPLHDAGQAFEAHAGIDVGMGERLIVAVPV